MPTGSPAATMREASVAAGLVQGFLAFAALRGVDADALCRHAGIDLTALADQDERVPLAAYIALVRAAKQACGDGALPLHYAEADDMAQFSVVGLLAAASETMLDAFNQLVRYGRLVVDVGAADRFRIDRRGETLWLVDQRPDPDAFPELTETTFARMVCGPRRFLPRQHVLEVHVTHPPPAHRAVYEQVFRCPVTFNSHWNALRLDHELLSHRVALQPRYVFGVLSAHADTLMQKLAQATTARGRVESLLMPVLHTGAVGVETIAGKLGMSRQTLYRALKAEGVTYEQVLDDLRHRLALEYLGASRVSVNETAYLVGFSDPAAFSRAFKRWTGASPRSVRAAKT